MKSTLILQPTHASTADILRKFSVGKPLTSKQLNFLDWHQHQLSSMQFDPVLKYYLSPKKIKQANKNSFLLPTPQLNKSNMETFKKRLSLCLTTVKTPQLTQRALLIFTYSEYLKFIELTQRDLIFWHGNQYLTGMAFYPAGIPPVIYFQWGNFFGIAKFMVLSEEKVLKANILIYFEDLEERTLDECVFNYRNIHQKELEEQKNLLEENKIEVDDSIHHFLLKPVFR